jgi:hypothetical protein
MIRGAVVADKLMSRQSAQVTANSPQSQPKLQVIFPQPALTAITRNV